MPQTLKEVPVPDYVGDTLLYLRENARIPTGRVSSTARLGRKWFDLLMPGEVFKCCTTDGALLFRAVCVAKDLTTYANVLRTANDNHVGWDGDEPVPAIVAAHRLRNALERSYGKDYNLADNTAFTKIFMMPLTIDWGADVLHSLYNAARWTADRPVEPSEVALWTRVRDAFGFQPGASTKKLFPGA